MPTPDGRLRFAPHWPNDLAEVPEAVTALRRRLDLVELISALLDAEPDLAPRAALYDLADSLARVLDEMNGEGVAPEVLEALDVSDMSGHWARALRCRTIARRFQDDGEARRDTEARQRLVTQMTLAAWAEDPPQDPVILAGSTGSRGSTNLLMQGGARLPQGAVVLPGFDFEMPEDVWNRLDSALTGEDHPQFRFARLLAGLGMTPAEVLAWPGATSPSVARHRAVSHAHPPYATGRAVAGGTPPTCMIPEIEVSFGRVPIAPYETPGTPEMGLKVAELVGEHNTVLMEKHGVVSWSHTIEDAYFKMEIVEAFCRTVLVTTQLGVQPKQFSPKHLQDLLDIKKTRGVPDPRCGLKECELCDNDEWRPGVSCAVPASGAGYDATTGDPEAETVVQAVTAEIMNRLKG